MLTVKAVMLFRGVNRDGRQEVFRSDNNGFCIPFTGAFVRFYFESAWLRNQ